MCPESKGNTVKFYKFIRSVALRVRFEVEV